MCYLLRLFNRFGKERYLSVSFGAFDDVEFACVYNFFKVVAIVERFVGYTFHVFAERYGRKPPTFAKSIATDARGFVRKRYFG